MKAIASYVQHTFALFLVLAAPWCRADVNKTTVDAGKRATALVAIFEGDKLKAWASAFCIDRSGIFITNHHVATSGEKNNKLVLIIDSGTRTQRIIRATILSTDERNDLAVLRADHAGPYESLELSDPAGIRGLTETAQVTVFGFPLGAALSLREDAAPEASITLSRITALRHDGGELMLIQLDGSINHGNSGGPVVDERGKVVGIISSGLPGKAISFAIPANRVGHLLTAANVAVTSHTPADASGAFNEVLADESAQVLDTPGRTAAPDDAARKAAQQVIHDLMAKEFADTTPKGKRALGAALLARGLATADDPAGAFELLSEAGDAAADCGDLVTAMKAAGELGRRYDVNAAAVKANVFTRIAPRIITPFDRGALAAHGVIAAQALVGRDLYADAQKLLPLIRDAATNSYSVPVQKQVREKLALVDSACAQYTVAEPAINKLKVAPNDPEANLAVGRFECFVRSNFDKGLPLLAKGSDAALKAAAVADLAKPFNGPGCKVAGDGWWDQSVKESKDAVAASACKARAGYWYRLGVDQLEGLTKTLVVQRLSTLPAPAQTPAEQGSVVSAGTPGPTPVQGPGVSPVTPAMPGPSVPPASGAPPAPVVVPEPVDGIYKLNTVQLPAAFRATGAFTVSDTGLKPDAKCKIITRSGDFLSKDFVFEASVDVTKKDELTIGLGDGTEKGSLQLTIRSDNNFGWFAFIRLGDRWGKRVGPIRTPGPRVMRLVRHGTAVTVAVGIDNGGKFEPDMSQTVADAKSAVHEMTTHDAYLFFDGKGYWSQVRLLTGAAASPQPLRAAAPPAPATPVPAATPVVLPVAVTPAPPRPTTAIAPPASAPAVVRPAVVAVAPPPVAPTPAPSTPPPAVPAPAVPAPGPGATVDLLAGIDPANDTLAGRWQRVRDALILLDVHDKGDSQIRFNQAFPAEYDLSLTFTVAKAPYSDHVVGLQIPAGGAIHEFGILSEAKDSHVGFWEVGHTLAKSRSSKIGPLKLNEAHHLVVKIRAASVEALVDGVAVYHRNGFSGLKQYDKTLLTAGKAEYVFREITLTVPAGM